MRYRGLAVIGFALLLGGCTTKKQLSADEYFTQANRDFHDSAFSLAIDEYRELLDQHPFSDYTEEAELKIAQAQYLDRDYVSAIVSFTDFQRRHPTSPHLPLVGYYLGMCYVEQMGTIDRDQTAAQSAHAYFSTLLNQYPESPFADLGRQQLAQCRESLAAHELYVAHFYDRRGNTRAAELRLLLMAAEYGDTPSAADGLLQLTRNYSDWKNPQYAALAYRALQKLHPGTDELQKASALIDRSAEAQTPPTSDPIDLLLIANGRRRPTASYTIPEVPRGGSRAPAPGPGPAVPQMDPFGRGNVGY